VSGSDVISLTGLRKYGYHGVLAHEREQGQDFVVDAEIELDLGPAARSDDVVDSVHYGELAIALAAVVAGEPVNLLETLAERLIDTCLSFPLVAAATITLHKPDAPITEAFTDVSVRMRRTRADRAAVSG
jgi:7,8-dihydroneopterin aldolase/epimerase/oxygenase